MITCLAFYRNMPKSGGISEALIFLLVMGVLSSAVFIALSFVGITGAGFASLSAIIIMPIGLLIGSFIAAALFFVIWKLMGSSEGFATTYRCIAYATAILPILTIVDNIPYVGVLVRTLWGTWLMIIASTEVHGRGQPLSNIVFGGLAILGLILGISGEYAARNAQAIAEEEVQEFIEQMKPLEDQAERLSEQLKPLENLGVNEDGEIDPEKMGRALGEFMKGLEEAVQEAEQAAEESK